LVKTRVETVFAQEFANVVIQKPHISKAHAVLEPLGEIWLPISVADRVVDVVLGTADS